MPNTYAGLTTILGGTLALSGSGSVGAGGLDLGINGAFDLAALAGGTYSLPSIVLERERHGPRRGEVCDVQPRDGLHWHRARAGVLGSGTGRCGCCNSRPASSRTVYDVTDPKARSHS